MSSGVVCLTFFQAPGAVGEHEEERHRPGRQQVRSGDPGHSQSCDHAGHRQWGYDEERRFDEREEHQQHHHWMP